MTTRQRVAKVEGSLTDVDVLLLELDAMQQYPGLPEYAAALVDLPVSEAPMSRITEQVATSVSASMKGQPREVIDRAVRTAIDDALLRYILIMVINESAHETAKLESVRAAALMFFMGMLLGQQLPDEPEPSELDGWLARWREWVIAVEGLTRLVDRREKARIILERCYLVGHPCLFADVAAEWAELRHQVGELVRLQGMNPFVALAFEGHDRQPIAAGSTATDEAAHLLDLARIRTFERIGEHPSAVAIMERRLRAG